APPEVVNPGRPARDVTLVRTATGSAVAASDLGGDTVSVYAFMGRPRTPPTLVSIVSAGRLPQRIAAEDLDGNGLDDLVIANTLDNTVSIAFQQADGSFRNTRTLAVGVTPSDLTFADADGRDG